VYDTVPTMPGEGNRVFGVPVQVATKERAARQILRGFLEFRHLQDRSSLFDEGRDVIFCKDS
jgi:hypothetical protein